jgi:hypothetical protein
MTASTAAPPLLAPSDQAALGRLGIPLGLLAEARVQRVSDREAREDFGIKGAPSMDMAGVIFPYYIPAVDYRVTARLRRDNPEIEDGKSKNKYISAYGDGRHLYFPPGAAEKLKQPDISIALVEAEKSALALTAWAERMQMDLLPLGLGGCYGWRGRIGKVENERGERVDELGPLSDLSYCNGRKAYVLFDSNAATNPKVRKARAELAAALRKRGCEVLICNLPIGEGVNGPDDFIAICGDDAMAKVFADAETPALNEWPEPEMLGSELPPVPPFDADLLPSSLRPMVEDVANRMQVPLDFPAIVCVSTLAGLCGRRALIQPKAHDGSWLIVPNLWGAIIATPGMMKSPVIASVTAPARGLEAQWRTEHKNAMQLYEAAQEKATLDNSVWSEEYKRAAKKQQPAPLKPEVNEIAKPVQRRLIAVDATFESLHQLLAENDAGIFVLRDELTGWLASLERQGRESERAFYLECWSGDQGFTIDRIGRGSIHVEHCCASLFGGIQPARLRAYVASALRDGPTNDGLIQRFQLLVWPDTKKGWTYQDRPPDAKAMKKAESVYRRIAEMDADRPIRLKFTPDAQALFVDWLTDLETRLRSDDTSNYMQAHLAKYRKLMPALALLFSIADGELEAVGLHYAQQAADWCEYLAHHAHRVYASRISTERLSAISLAQKLTKGWKRESGTFTARDVYQNDWSGLGTADEVRAALRLLEDAGWVRLEKPRSETGRPSEVYAINPKIGGVRVDN